MECITNTASLRVPHALKQNVPTNDFILKCERASGPASTGPEAGERQGAAGYKLNLPIFRPYKSNYHVRLVPEKRIANPGL